MNGDSCDNPQLHRATALHIAGFVAYLFHASLLSVDEIASGFQIHPEATSHP
jgi:hypothetical protein